MSRRSFASLAVATFALLPLAACGDDDEGGTDAAGAVLVESSKDACTPETTVFEPGTVKFGVKNTGGDATELYVYLGDKVIGEVENVGPGTTRTLTVKLETGKTGYKLVCKPGQKGDGISVPITVEG